MKTILLLVIPVLFLVSACETLIQIEPPRTQIATEEVFTTEETATAATLRLYNGFNQLGTGFYGVILGNISSDEFQSGAAALQPYLNNSIAANDGVLLTYVWYPYYQSIYRANAIINGLTNSTGTDESLKSELIAEAKAIRAYCYFYLVNFFGKIPLLTDTDVQANLRVYRSDFADVWKLIEADLTDAIADLPEAYQSSERTRINRSTGYALLARVKLYLNKWAEAEAAATEVINDPAYLLEPDLGNVFLTDSRETIWQGWIESGYTTVGSIIVPSSASSIPNLVLNQKFVESLSEIDSRKQNWIGTNINAENKYDYPTKYKRRTPTSVLPREYLVLLRLAEQYLIRAEARAEQNNLAEGAEDLDAVRLRSGLPAIADSETQLTREELLLAIEQERLRELFAEGSHRWFDLKRTGRIDEVMTSAKGENWHSTAAFYPIPQQEIYNNSNLLPQNEGYE